MTMQDSTDNCECKKCVIHRAEMADAARYDTQQWQQKYQEWQTAQATRNADEENES